MTNFKRQHQQPWISKRFPFSFRKCEVYFQQLQQFLACPCKKICRENLKINPRSLLSTSFRLYFLLSSSQLPLACDLQWLTSLLHEIKTIEADTMGITRLRDTISRPPKYDTRVLATTSTFSVKQFGTYTFGFMSEICRHIRFFSALRILHNHCFGSEDMRTFVSTWSTVSIRNGNLLMLVLTPAVLVLLVAPSFRLVPPQTLVFHFPSWPSFPYPFYSTHFA